jgi:hypothetical protein
MPIAAPDEIVAPIPDALEIVLRVVASERISVTGPFAGLTMMVDDTGSKTAPAGNVPEDGPVRPPLSVLYRARSGLRRFQGVPDRDNLWAKRGGSPS